MEKKGMLNGETIHAMLQGSSSAGIQSAHEKQGGNRRKAVVPQACRKAMGRRGGSGGGRCGVVALEGVAARWW